MTICTPYREPFSAPTGSVAKRERSNGQERPKEGEDGKKENEEKSGNKGRWMGKRGERIMPLLRNPVQATGHLDYQVKLALSRFSI